MIEADTWGCVCTDQPREVVAREDYERLRVLLREAKRYVEDELTCRNNNDLPMRVQESLIDRIDAALGTAVQPSDADLLDFGYAPGHYSGPCLGCGKTVHSIDKRASKCRPCAVKQWEQRATVQPSAERP